MRCAFHRVLFCLEHVPFQGFNALQDYIPLEILQHFVRGDFYVPVQIIMGHIVDAKVEGQPDSEEVYSTR